MGENLPELVNTQKYGLLPFLDITRRDITIVIPVLNEEQAIGDVIKQIKSTGYENIIVVDGYSTDNTVTVAKDSGVDVIYQSGKGKSGAIETAVRNVYTPYFIVLDGDSTYDPTDIQNFIPHMVENDEVIGIRTYGRSNIPKFNRFGNWVINTTFNFLFNTNFKDVCSGMYAIKTSFGKDLVFETSGFDVEVEIAAQVARNGTFAQVPIHYNKRVGQQKLRPIRHGIQIQLSIIALALKYNPVFIYSAIASLCLIPAIYFLALSSWQYFNGILNANYVLLGFVLLLVGLFSLILSTVSILLKRMELRIIQKIKSIFS
jgi:dolichol-phosphate mannosyltransferase